MKKVSFYSLLLSVFVAAIFSLVACNDSSDKKPEQTKLSIVTTIYPEYAWVKEILGQRADSVELTLLIKNGVDLHSYKPTAQDIAKIASANMVVYVGGESDKWIKDALAATPKKGRSEINLMETLGDRVKAEEIVEGMDAEHHHHHHEEHAEEHEHEHHSEHVEEHEHEHHSEHAEEHEHEHHSEHAEAHEHDEHHKMHAQHRSKIGKKHEHHDEHAEEHEHDEHHSEHAEAHEHHHDHEEEVENDEHVWLSLKNAEILVQKITVELAKLDMAHGTAYKDNATDYIARIKALDGDYRTAIENASRKTILFGDRFPFRYLVDDYGIKYYAAFVGCSAESEASFETIAFLAGKMDSDSLPAILTIEKGNKKIANAVLAASKNSKDAQILTINSMQAVTEQQIAEGESYLSIMQTNLEILKKALN
jgi:zinc transport system substrate-binding protein